VTAPPESTDANHHHRRKTVKVQVDPQRCQGHTLCAMIAPQAFQLDDIDGHSSVVSEDVPADQQEQVAEAVRSCPEQAISIS
jgi:ferredoxin